MELAALRAFVAVAETASFSVAAKRLHLTQPAVSKRIRALESELDTRLFDRMATQVALTESGLTLLDAARAILSDVAKAEDQVRSLDREVGGRLRIGTSHHVGIHRLPPVLREYKRTFPKVKLDLKFLDSELACAQVEQGQLELAVVTLPQNTPNNLLTTLIWPDPLVVVVPLQHELDGQIEPADLARYPAILPAIGTITRSILETSLEPFDVRIEVALETNYLETIKMMVSVGLGWSVLPSSMVAGDLRALSVPRLNMQRSLGIVRQRKRSLSRAAARFVELLQRSKVVPPLG